MPRSHTIPDSGICGHSFHKTTGHMHHANGRPCPYSHRDRGCNCTSRKSSYSQGNGHEWKREQVETTPQACRGVPSRFDDRYCRCTGRLPKPGDQDHRAASAGWRSGRAAPYSGRQAFRPVGPAGDHRESTRGSQQHRSGGRREGRTRRIHSACGSAGIARDQSALLSEVGV